MNASQPPRGGETPAIGPGSSKPPWTDPGSTIGPAVEPSRNFQFPAADPRVIDKYRRRRRAQTLRIYATLVAILAALAAFAARQFYAQRVNEPAPTKPASASTSVAP